MPNTEHSTPITEHRRPHHRFCVEAECLRAEPVHVEGAAARQMLRVLRLAAGDQVTLFCGDGEEHEAAIVAVTEGRLELRITATRRPAVEHGCKLEFGLALLRGEKLDWTTQKLTELGVARICFVVTERQVAAAREERWGKRLARLEAIAREAVEQCGGVRLPELSGPTPLANYLRSGTEPTLVAHPSAMMPIEAALEARPQEVRVLIGPEGGFGPAELEGARAAGAIPVSLGARVLRSETAAIAAAARIAARLG